MTSLLSSEFAPIFDEPLRPVPRTWVIGAVGALALHVAGAAVVFGYLRDTGVDLGAPGLIVDIELTPPRRAPNDLPVGPDTEASARAPAVVEQKTVIEKTDLPKDAPTDTDDPERFVSREDEQPVDQDPKISAVQAAPSNPSIAAEETAVPSVATSRKSSSHIRRRRARERARYANGSPGRRNSPLISINSSAIPRIARRARLKSLSTSC